MYPDLSYLFHDLLGTAYDNWLSVFKMFGFVLAISFLVSAVVYYAELRRKQREGMFVPEEGEITEGAPATWQEIAMNALVGLIFGGKGGLIAQDSAAFQYDPAAVILSGKMHWPAALLGALLLGGFTWWDAWRKRKDKPVTSKIKIWPADRIAEMTMWAAVGGILGAKLFDIFDTLATRDGREAFMADPLGALLSGGGLAFYGGLILGAALVIRYIIKKKIPLLAAIDACAPALVAGYGVGRIGCQLSGDGDWGMVNAAPKPGWLSWLPDWAWSYRYPHTVLGDGWEHKSAELALDVKNNIILTRMADFQGRYAYQLEQPVWPTPFYETMMMLAVFGILWALRKRIKTPGLLFCLYIALIAVERFFIEFIRINPLYNVLGAELSQAQIISLFLLLASGLGAWWLTKRKN